MNWSAALHKARARSASPPESSATRAASASADAASGNLPLRSAATVAVLLMVEFKPAARWWGWSRLVLQGVGLRGLPGLCFAKVLGSGQNGGFGVKPSATHQGLFLAFDDEAAALQVVLHHPQLAAYRQHAQTWGVVGLRVSSSRGAWSGHRLLPSVAAPTAGPVGVLTRASIKPVKAQAFWRLSPASEAALAAAPGCRVAMGLGEAPLLRQATFSIWRSTAEMEAFAHSGAHLQAARAAYGGGHFSETLFTRFVPLWGQGHWQGVDLAGWLGGCPDLGPALHSHPFQRTP